MTPTIKASVEFDESAWPAWASDVAPHVGANQKFLFRFFTDWMARNAVQIWNGQLDYCLDMEQQEKLRDQLIIKCPTKSASNEIALASWWDCLISAGKLANKWQIALLPQVVKLPAPSPAYVRRDFQLLPLFRELEEVSFSLIKSGLDVTQLHPMIVVSAIVFGGVTSIPMLCAIVNMEAIAIRGFDGELRVTLQLPYRGKDLIAQTWYPDAMTSALIVQWLKAMKEPYVGFGLREKSVLHRHLEKTLAQLNLPVMVAGDLLRVARVAFSFGVSPYVAAYLADEVQAQSLPLDVLQRLSGWCAMPGGADAVPLSNLDHQKSTDRLLEFQSEFDPLSKPLDQLRFVSKVVAILGKVSSSVTDIEGELATHGKGAWPVTSLLCKWICWRQGEPLVKHDPSTGIKAIGKSSSQRYLGAVARHLIIVAGQENPMDMEVDDLESLYEYSAERVKTPQERAYFWMCIKSFHAFLMLHGAPEVTLDELDGFVSDRRGTVTANLVGEREFALFKSELKRTASIESNSFATMVFLAAVLGYRCGLRRREVQMLWLSNVQLGADPFLLVRASSLATLKSHSARRRIPLKSLLLPDELAVLEEYCKQRSNALGGGMGLLFSNPEAPRVPLLDRLLFDPITRAFQAILGDGVAVFRFHHLRHSFANWLFLALLIADNPELKSESPFLKNAPLLADRLSVLQQAFFPRLSGTLKSPTRKNLYLVSYLCGHLSPSTTSRWYLHLLDWLAGREADIAVAPKLAEVTQEELARICGLSPATLHTQTYRGLLKDRVGFLRKFVARQLPISQSERPSGVQASVNLDAIFARIEEMPVPGPSRLMVILFHATKIENSLPHDLDEESRQRIRSAAFDRLERNHCVPRQVVEKLWFYYRSLVAKQSNQRPKAGFLLPSVPRTLEDATEFWRIVDAAVASFRSVRLRPAMIDAAKLLVQRTGPSTGNVYFGKHPAMAPIVVKGLVAMGVVPTCLNLEIRVPDTPVSRDQDIGAIARAVESMGVAVERVRLNWQERTAIGELLLLRVNNKVVGRSHEELKQMVGRVRGINYSALWILFAHAMTLMSAPVQRNEV